jgi:hypothetical protein
LRRASSVILFSLLAGLAVPVASDAQVICTGNASPPPELPVYEQPPIPAPGYVWEKEMLKWLRDRNASR